MSILENIGKEIVKGVEGAVSEVGKVINGISKGDINVGREVEGVINGVVGAVNGVAGQSPEQNKQNLIAILQLAGIASNGQTRVQQVDQIIDQGGLPKDDVEKGQKAIVDKIAQAPTREDAKAELKDISRGVRVIWTLFEIIEDELVIVDKKRLFRTQNGGEHVPLVPKWKELMEVYDQFNPP